MAKWKIYEQRKILSKFHTKISHTVPWYSFVRDLKRCQVRANLFLLVLTIIGILFMILIISFEFPIKYLFTCLPLLHSFLNVFCWLVCLSRVFIQRRRERRNVNKSEDQSVQRHTQFYFLKCIHHYKSVISFHSQISNSCCAILSTAGYFGVNKSVQGTWEWSLDASELSAFSAHV